MSSTYTVTRDQIITLALRKLGVIELTDTPDANTIASVSMSLNLLIKQLSIEGLKLWKISELIVPLTASQTKYVLGGNGSATMYDSLAPNTPITDRPLKVIQAFYRNTSVTPNVDTPVQLLSKQEYNILGSKGSTGATNSLFYDVKATNGQLYVYLTPDVYTATNLQLRLIAQMPLNDLNGASDIPDFPNEWMNCLVWNLADQLSMEFGVPMNYRQEITMRATAYREALTDWDVEPTSSFFQPDFRMSNASAYSR